MPVVVVAPTPRHSPSTIPYASIRTYLPIATEIQRERDLQSSSNVSAKSKLTGGNVLTIKTVVQGATAIPTKAGGRPEPTAKLTQGCNAR